ncbi:MAG: phosphate acyltransferase PlsX [Clostridiales bacterium]|nr:phosphate acyltransferase PlsX [Clostridiales bacterium]MDD7415503.1 phosphate acyltransferase PlsX [Clostridiales bacterium]MDY5732024.1 phosphate acyltransferase PlsX [Eubacteriales bacterium]
MKIAVDIFGGDNSPSALIDGCVDAAKLYDDVEFIFTGDERVITDYMSEKGYGSSRISIIDAPETITCGEQPTVAIKRKKNSSLVKALELVASKEADAFVSAGSTGAVLAGATLIVRRIKGVKRPALAPVMPTVKGPVLLIDCGANVDCKPNYLQQFAVMGSAYMKKVCGIDAPRVGLINNGAEAEKGNELTKSAYKLLENTDINFVGNCEARYTMTGDYDVLVCDGFVGNAVLKCTEGVARSVMSIMKQELMASPITKLGALISKSGFKRVKKRMDYTEYGGAPLLGINGCIIKAHGSSNAKAITSAIGQARSYCIGDVTAAIQSGIEALPECED